MSLCCYLFINIVLMRCLSLYPHLLRTSTQGIVVVFATPTAAFSSYIASCPCRAWAVLDDHGMGPPAEQRVFENLDRIWRRNASRPARYSQPAASPTAGSRSLTESLAYAVNYSLYCTLLGNTRRIKRVTSLFFEDKVALFVVSIHQIFCYCYNTEVRRTAYCNQSCTIFV